MFIKKGDTVIVRSGKDKGKTGKVVKAFPKKSSVIVAGVHVRKKHERPKRGGQKGQIVEKALPIHVSSVMLVDSESGKGTRVGFKMVGGKKMRVAVKSGKEIK
ncbi:MAG: 50S ribosomal protein L24 [Candidatus Taylorbacteria bacterium RIFCSPHIGHO2_01_FULL_45_63]|uniref:Large ribosomal subunit protein uL24 n=1 Tax=Candidatus Taylorbacteria bacterium RIFCSPHIGHO2_02_FULL_45_35 TaxID=1802311 RepID=A0A1G2MSK6_9BACT|nr:MAG: 50S ribosomal protein L24 [Candidatus Taylorbacteria bacterium RIFCSPHIGHO2_01_FULL_45_63]OHA26823.1 MAG: 50S ribosomal protein L24 [Candidatus Taylorbacteria bacterium RIFCSPHIGHO2_02_FULL_45_35]OHA33616.1 MAG: 50S ribosomal protein L24 [Candidatus Taylorbacteria bacterium RIFCSPLOWO2_01_FULL_45_34b]